MYSKPVVNNGMSTTFPSTGDRRISSMNSMVLRLSPLKPDLSWSSLPPFLLFCTEHPSILDFTQGAIEGPVPWKQLTKLYIFSFLCGVTQGNVCVLSYNFLKYQVFVSKETPTLNERWIITTHLTFCSLVMSSRWVWFFSLKFWKKKSTFTNKCLKHTTSPKPPILRAFRVSIGLRKSSPCLATVLMDSADFMTGLLEFPNCDTQSMMCFPFLSWTPTWKRPVNYPKFNLGQKNIII